MIFARCDFFVRCPIPKLDLTSVGPTWSPDSEVSLVSSQWINRSLFEIHILRCMVVDWSQAVVGIWLSIFCNSPIAGNNLYNILNILILILIFLQYSVYIYIILINLFFNSSMAVCIFNY